MSNSSGPEFFVSAATVAGKLTSVMRIAQEISLAAKNAKAIAERAGEKASGFKPITDFIDEMGRETIELVQSINTEALKVSRSAVIELRSRDAEQRLKLAIERMGESKDSDHLTALLNKSDLELEKLNDEVNSRANNLQMLLEEIGGRMRAASVISTRSRVEATRAEEYQTSLEVVAETVENASEKIKNIVRDCDRILKETI